MKTYLGDSVYVDYDGWHIVITTENGYGTNNTILLEPKVLKALSDYLDQQKQRRQGSSPDSAA